MEIAVVAKLRNGPMVRYRKENGFNQREAAESVGVHHTTWNQLEVLRFTGWITTNVIRRVADAIGVSPEAICPDEFRRADLRADRVANKHVESERLLEIQASNRSHLPVENGERERIVDDALRQLTHREREVIKLRYGFTEDGHSYTLMEVSRIFKVTRERVRQIEQCALHKLRDRPVAEILESVT